ncbi:MAG: hypothetical protein WCI95_08660 [bacterium]
MKLKHSKKWYEIHIAAEGDLEIGAGIPPDAKVQARNSERMSFVIALGDIHTLARRPVKSSIAHGVKRRQAKVCCHA